MNRNLLALLTLDTLTVVIGWVIYLANVPAGTSLFLFASQTILILGLISTGFTFFYSFIMGGHNRILWPALAVLIIGVVVAFINWFAGGVIVLVSLLLLLLSREVGSKNYVPLVLIFTGFVVLTLIPPIEAMSGVVNTTLDDIVIIISLGVIIFGLYLSLRRNIAVESYMGYVVLSLIFFLLPPYHEIFGIKSNGSYGIYDMAIIITSTVLYFIFFFGLFYALHREEKVFDEIQRGYKELSMGDWEKAELTFRGIRESGYIDPSVLNGLGVALMHQGKYDESEKLLKEAVELNDRDEYRTNLGNLYYRKGDINKAIEIYRKVLKRNPDCYIALNNMGRCLLKKGKIKEAKKYLERAMKINPQGSVARKNYNLIKNGE